MVSLRIKSMLIGTIVFSTIFAIVFFVGSGETIETWLSSESIEGVVSAAGIESDENIGYEYLNQSEDVVIPSEATVVHIWNSEDDYYFNKSSGIQFSNHFNEYWTHNIFCAGYKNALNEWIYDCNDALPFTWNLKTDNETYVNITGVRVKTISPTKKVRMAVRYHLELDDQNLSTQLSIENIGTEDITNDLGFAWVVNNIKIGNDEEDDSIFINYTNYNLHDVTSVNFTNLENSYYRLWDDAFVQLDWNNSLNYKLEIQNISQYNARVSLGINAGPLSIGQEKHTTLYWRDPSISFGTVASGITDDLWDTPLVWEHDITCGSDMELIVGIAIDSEATIIIDTITYNNAPLSKISRISGTGVEAELWNLSAPDCGNPYWVNVTWASDSSEEAAGMSIVYYGVDQINMSSLNSSVGAGAGASELSVPTGSDENWAVNIFSLDVDPGSGISVSGDNAVQRGYRDELSAITVAIADGYDSDGEVTMAWSGFNDEWVQIGVELIPKVGDLSINITNPDNESNWYTGNTNLTVSAMINCTSGACGIVTASVRYNLTATPDTLISNVVDTEPFYVIVEPFIWDILNDEGDGVPEASEIFIGDDSGNDYIKNTYIHFTPGESFTLDEISFYIGGTGGSDYGILVDIYICEDDGAYANKNCVLVENDYDPVWTNGLVNIILDNKVSLAGGTTYSVDFRGDSTDTDGAQDVLLMRTDTSPITVTFARRYTDEATGGAGEYGDMQLEGEIGNPKSLNLNSGEWWNVSWNLTVVSASTENYLVDVLVNSSWGEELLPANNSEDRLIHLNPGGEPPAAGDCWTVTASGMLKIEPPGCLWNGSLSGILGKME